MLSLLFVDNLSVDGWTMGLFSNVIGMLGVWTLVVVVCSVIVVGSSVIVVGSSVVVVGSSVEVSESQLFIWLGSWQLSVRLPFEEARK